MVTKSRENLLLLTTDNDNAVNIGGKRDNNNQSHQQQNNIGYASKLLQTNSLKQQHSQEMLPSLSLVASTTAQNQGQQFHQSGHAAFHPNQNQNNNPSSSNQHHHSLRRNVDGIISRTTEQLQAIQPQGDPTNIMAVASSLTSKDASLQPCQQVNEPSSRCSSSQDQPHKEGGILLQIEDQQLRQRQLNFTSATMSIDGSGVNQSYEVAQDIIDEEVASSIGNQQILYSGSKASAIRKNGLMRHTKMGKNSQGSAACLKTRNEQHQTQCPLIIAESSCKDQRQQMQHFKNNYSNYDITGAVVKNNNTQQESDNQPMVLDQNQLPINSMQLTARCNVGNQQSSDTQQKQLDSIHDFIDQNRILLSGKIGQYKINFSRNLKRFQEIAAEQAEKEPHLAEITDKLLQDTLIPSVWGTIQQNQQQTTSKLLRSSTQQIQQQSQNQTEDQKAEEEFSTITTQQTKEQSQEMSYQLLSTSLPFQINFNPLMITYCIFLRAVADIVDKQSQLENNHKATSSRTETEGCDNNQKTSMSDKIADFCLVQRKKIVQNLHQIQIKAVNHALQSLSSFNTQAADNATEAAEGDQKNMQQPLKVIEFIKKWVAKEKTLINNYCVKTLQIGSVQGSNQKAASQQKEPDSGVCSVDKKQVKQQQQNQNATSSANNKNTVNSSNGIDQKLAAKKNLEKFVTTTKRGGGPTAKHLNHRVHHNPHQQNLGIVDNQQFTTTSSGMLTKDKQQSSAETLQLPASNDLRHTAKMASEIGLMTQDNFYKVNHDQPAADQLINSGGSPLKLSENTTLSNQNNLLQKQQQSSQNVKNDQRGTQQNVGKSLQQKVNSRHRENQHRNLFVEYHQMGQGQNYNNGIVSSSNSTTSTTANACALATNNGYDALNKQQAQPTTSSMIFRVDQVPQMAQSSTNFNSNKNTEVTGGIDYRSNSSLAQNLSSSKATLMQHSTTMQGHHMKKQGATSNNCSQTRRSGLITDVYGDWKQQQQQQQNFQKGNNMNRGNSKGVGKMIDEMNPDNDIDQQRQQQIQHQTDLSVASSSHRQSQNINRSYSPSNFQHLPIATKPVPQNIKNKSNKNHSYPHQHNHLAVIKKQKQDTHHHQHQSSSVALNTVDNNTKEITDHLHEQTTTSKQYNKVRLNNRGTTAGNKIQISGAQTVSSGFYNSYVPSSTTSGVDQNLGHHGHGSGNGSVGSHQLQRQHQHMHHYSSHSLHGVTNPSTNQNNFHWSRANGPDQAHQQIDTNSASCAPPPILAPVVRPQTRDSYFGASAVDHNGQNHLLSVSRRQKNHQNQGSGQQSLVGLTGTSATMMMRSSGGPSAFNLNGGRVNGHHGGSQFGGGALRPSTRHGSDERQSGRPITQGINRRTTAGLVNNGMAPTSTIQKRPNEQVQILDNYQQQQNLKNQKDNAYLNKQSQGKVLLEKQQHIYNIRQSSRGTGAPNNRLSGTISGSSPNLNEKGGFKYGSVRAAKGGLETLQSLPDGYDPIFNPTSNKNYLNNDKSNIKVKAMKPGKAFEQMFDINGQQSCQNNNQQQQQQCFEASETSSISYLSKGGGSSVGFLESHVFQHHDLGSQRGLNLNQEENKQKNIVGGGFEHVSPIQSKIDHQQKYQQHDHNIADKRRNSFNSANSSSHAPPTDSSPALQSHTSSSSVQQFRKKLTASTSNSSKVKKVTSSLTATNLHRAEATTTALESILETDENQVIKEGQGTTESAVTSPQVNATNQQQKILLQRHHTRQKLQDHQSNDSGVNEKIMETNTQQKSAQHLSQIHRNSSKKVKQKSQQQKTKTTTSSSIKNTTNNVVEEQLSTMQTSSGGFSNTRGRSPREPSYDSTQKRTVVENLQQTSQLQNLRLRPQLLSSNSSTNISQAQQSSSGAPYNSLQSNSKSVTPGDQTKTNSTFSSLRNIGVNNGIVFNNIIPKEEEEFAYYKDRLQQLEKLQDNHEKSALPQMNKKNSNKSQNGGAHHKTTTPGALSGNSLR